MNTILSNCLFYVFKIVKEWHHNKIIINNLMSKHKELQIINQYNF